MLSTSRDVEGLEETSSVRPTLLWYLVPFFFGILGGIVGYVGTKDEDKDMASGLLLFGAVWSIILYIFYWIALSSLIFHAR
jgi:positive regulator of sigma E activity